MGDGGQGTGAATDSGSDSEAGTTGDASADSTSEGTGADSTGAPPQGPDPLPPLAAAPLTTEVTLVPLLPYPREPVLDPRLPEDRATLLDDGHGTLEMGPGEPIEDRTPTGEPPTPAGPDATMITRFVHLADSQLVDDEAATRVVNLDQAVFGAFRPEEAYSCNILDAAVRTINRVNEDLPLDFVVLGGDNVDNAQSNELSWFLGIMEGDTSVHCDSGEDNDPEPGEGNDPKDLFTPVGLDVPWFWVTGNHDTEVQGNFLAAERAAAAIGDANPGGTRDWSMPGGPVIAGDIIADDARAVLSQESMLSAVAGSGDGHGIDDEVIARGKANYTFDVEGTALRFVVLDSSAFDAGGSDGLIREGDVDSFLRPALDAAEGDAKVVVVVSHHASASFAPVVDDAYSEADFRALLGEYNNVLMHLAGHSHVHSAEFVAPMDGHGYWEVITSALLDYPNQMRVIEIHDQNNGEYRIQMVSLDYQIEDDPLGEAGRALTVLDWTTGWVEPANSEATDRNVSLYVATP